MRNLFDDSDECLCRKIGVVVGDSGQLKYCTCPDGVREQGQDAGGYGPFIGRPAIDVVRELQSTLKGL